MDKGFIYEALFLFWQIRLFPLDLFSVRDSCELLLYDIQCLCTDGLLKGRSIVQETREDFFQRTLRCLEEILLDG
jgi:hypothetical protein